MMKLDLRDEAKEIKERFEGKDLITLDELLDEFVNVLDELDGVNQELEDLKEQEKEMSADDYNADAYYEAVMNSL